MYVPSNLNAPLNLLATIVKEGPNLRGLPAKSRTYLGGPVENGLSIAGPSNPCLDIGDI